MLLRGCFRILFLYDVADALDLNRVREQLGPGAGPVKPVFPRRTPEYVRFENVPIEEPAERITLGTDNEVLCSIKYYAFGVAVVQMEVSFEYDWKRLLAETSRWSDAAEFEPRARESLHKRLGRFAALTVRPQNEWLQEHYLIVNVEEVRDPAGTAPPTAAELLLAHAPEIAQLIRGELTPLAPILIEELPKASISYYASDLVVIGSAAALVYDRSEDAAASNRVLEYSKMQLLEFRYYDGLMTRLLSDVYDTLDRPRNILLSRWSIPREARRINTIRLDVMELTERVDNALKFVSEVYYARLYRLAAQRMGVPEYRSLVDEKLRTVGELYDFMVDQFNESRSFVLEVGVAILALLDVIFLLRGK